MSIFQQKHNPRRRLSWLDDVLTPHLVVTAGLQEVTKLLGQGLGGTKFDAMAIGTDATAAAAGQTALVAEITTGGGSRKGAGDVTASLVTNTVTDDTIRFVATWTFSASFGVNELGVFNNNTSGGAMLLRQVFASVLNVVAADILELTVDVTSSDDVVDTGVSVLTNAGFAEGNKLIATDLTPANGPLRYIALGSGSTAPAATQTALVTEITTNGLAREDASTGTGHSIALATTNVSNDTVKLTVQWEVTGTQAVREVGVFNHATAGQMFLRHVFAADLNLVNTDTFTMIVNHVQVS